MPRPMVHPLDMKIAICGAGVAGTYVYKYLTDRCFNVDIFDIDKSKLGCHCAWGVETSSFLDYMRHIQIDGNKYILKKIDRVFVYMNNGPHRLVESIGVHNFSTINKKKLMMDIVGKELKIDSCINVEDYDLVIDATGGRRYYISGFDVVKQPKGVFQIPTMQIRHSEPWNNYEDNVVIEPIKGGVGYIWSFPLGKLGYHYGCGDLKVDLKELMFEDGLPKGKKCECGQTYISVGPPDLWKPFMMKTSRYGIWGVGEAIGCVSPISGEGIIPSLESAHIFCDMFVHGKLTPGAYEKAICEANKWMWPEYKTIASLMDGRWRMTFPLNFMKSMMNGKRKFGVDMGLRTILRLLLRYKRM